MRFVLGVLLGLALYWVAIHPKTVKTHLNSVLEQAQTTINQRR